MTHLGKSRTGSLLHATHLIQKACFSSAPKLTNPSTSFMEKVMGGVWGVGECGGGGQIDFKYCISPKSKIILLLINSPQSTVGKKAQQFGLVPPNKTLVWIIGAINIIKKKFLKRGNRWWKVRDKVGKERMEVAKKECFVWESEMRKKGEVVRKKTHKKNIWHKNCSGSKESRCFCSACRNLHIPVAICCMFMTSRQTKLTG